MHRFYKFTVLFSVLTIAGSSCTAQPSNPPSNSPSPLTASPASPLPASNRFDPATLQVGDRVQALTVKQVDVEEFVDGTRVGTVAFQGEITLSGTYKPHPQFPEVQSLCFDVDTASAVQLPRFAGDDRIVWFCFENQEAATQQLGAIGTPGKATIVIDNYTTVFQPTDVVDSALLVQVIARE